MFAEINFYRLSVFGIGLALFMIAPNLHLAIATVLGGLMLSMQILWLTIFCIPHKVLAKIFRLLLKFDESLVMRNFFFLFCHVRKCF